MKEKTKEIITDTIRWIMFLPIECLCLVIGYAASVNLLSFTEKFYRTGSLFNTITICVFLVVCTIAGARIMLPKHKIFATIVAIILCILFVTFMSWVTYQKYLEVNGI